MKYKLNISEGCTAGGYLEVNGIAYSCEDTQYELTQEQREKFREDLFAEIRRMFDDGEIGVNDLVQLLHVKDTHYSETCDQCGDTVVTIYYEFETNDDKPLTEDVFWSNYAPPVVHLRI